MLKSKEKMLGLKEKEIDERCEMLEAKEKRMLEDAKAMELVRKQLDERSIQMELKEKEIEERFLAVEAKELVGRDDKETNDFDKVIESKENKLNDQVEGDGHHILSNCQAQEYQGKHYGSRSLTNLRQELPNSEIHQTACSKDFSSSSSIGGDQVRSYCTKMDALFLGFCITDQVKAKTISPEGILDALRCAPNPGKLVMEVTRTFHQNFSDKNMTTIYKDSCILLLEQLMKLSPPITKHVKEEARHLAMLLKAAKNRTPTDNFGFLQFVAAFMLANCFNADDLVTLFGSFYCGCKIYRLEQQATLCNALGLSDKIPGLIKSYIQKKKLLTAVKCICIFKLEDIFPPEPLLENYLDMSNKKVNKKQKAGTFITKIEGIDKELLILRDVTSCIATFKLESRFPPDPLLSRIEELLKAKEERKAGALTQWNDNKRSASSCDSIASPEQLQKRPRIENNHQVQVAP
ncbi:FRIGIDA-like protein 2 [Chenopodium quinoa]|nr:FRIGIDA-like protein 2 [Chenopodium quinoa]